MNKPTIGFIGLGLMGVGFTKRLKAQGYRVLGYDIAAEKIEAAGAWGVEPAASPADIAKRSDIIQLCVVSTYAVDAVVTGENGIVSAGKLPGKVLVDHSTTEIEETLRLAGELEKNCGIAWVDAPVSGGPGAAETGTLAIMAGGSNAAIAKVKPVMAELAGAFTHMGKVGAGQATKMINQVLVLTNYAVIAEAVRLAEKCGLDANRIPEAVAGGHADSNLLRALVPRMTARDFAPRGFARQIMKDLDMVHDLSRDKKSPTPMCSQALALFRLLNARGHSELDGSAVLKLYLDEPV